MWPTWELQGHGASARSFAADAAVAGPGGRTTRGGLRPGGRTPTLPPWFNVRLTFADGARIDVLAVVAEDRISIEDMRADPPLPLDGFAALADWIDGPLEDACRVAVEQYRGGPGAPHPYFGHGDYEEDPLPRRARPAWPRGSAARRIAAEAYLQAQQDGRDPVVAVMCATGRSRRKSLKLIAGARDEGFLPPRHNRR